MQTALIVSLNFNPGHVSHLVASYKQCQELGYRSLLYIHPDFCDFVPADCEYLIYGKEQPQQADFAVFLFPSEKNIWEILRLKRKFKCRIIYIFHEPLERFSIYRKAGFSWGKLLKLAIINAVSNLTVRLSDAVVLPSRKALVLYDDNKNYKNGNRYYLPLMYDDQCGESYAQASRSYFSYIGTIASDHSYQEFFDFVCQAIEQKRLMSFKFLIATKNRVERTPRVEQLLASGRLEIIDGQPLTEEQINACYLSSFVVWNAYQRTTQSGVLAKSFMFGTPAIVLRKNLSEFCIAGQEVIAVDRNDTFSEIESAVLEIANNFSAFSECCRSRFMTSFYYKNYNDTFREIMNR